MKHYLAPIAALVLLLSACEQQAPLPTAPDPTVEPLAKTSQPPHQAEDFTRIRAFVDAVNKRLEDSGNELRLGYPWLFRVGPGTDPFGRLRNGIRWVDPTGLTWVYDGSDVTPGAPPGVPPADVEAAVESAFASWNAIENTGLLTSRVDDDGSNFDFLDGIVLNADGECVAVWDFGTSNATFDANGNLTSIDPAADIVFGGWLPNEYFEDCLGSSNILGVTWSLFLGDGNGDGYPDQVYAEMLYNEAFDWVTAGSFFLGPTQDIESVVVHEAGHAVGLGHFGGPIKGQPLRLRPNGHVFTPEAVMNPFYIGGEKRMPFPTDEAGLRTLYAQSK